MIRNGAGVGLAALAGVLARRDSGKSADGLMLVIVVFAVVVIGGWVRSSVPSSAACAGSDRGADKVIYPSLNIVVFVI